MTKKAFGLALTEVGNKIKVIRKNKGITQVQMSMDCDMEKATVSRIESGKTNVTLITLHRLATYLEVSVLEFFM